MIRLADFLEEDGHEVSVLVPIFLTENIKSKKVEVITFDVRFAYFCHRSISFASLLFISCTHFSKKFVE